MRYSTLYSFSQQCERGYRSHLLEPILGQRFVSTVIAYKGRPVWQKLDIVGYWLGDEIKRMKLY